MKILLISNMYPSKDHPFYGIFVQNFEKQLIQDNVIVHKVVVEGRGKNKREKIKKYLQFFKNIIINIKQDNFDLIYVHYVGHSLLPLLFVQKYIHKPLVINAHGGDILVTSVIHSIIQKLVTPIIQKADLIVVPTKYFKGLVNKKFSVVNEKIFISPSGGINTTLFIPLEKKENNTFTIGYVSRIDEGKGWDTLLDAISLLKTKSLKLRVLMIGGGSQEHLLLKKIDDLSLGTIVEYMGVKPHDELPVFFNQMDIFIFPTKLVESLGLVGLEAMACGTPVIGSYIGGLPTYIKSGVNGEFFEPSNIKQLSKQIVFFMNLNKDKIGKYQEGALMTSKKYDSKKVNHQLKEKLLEMVES